MNTPPPEHRTQRVGLALLGFEAGPVTYLVTHTDYASVEAFGYKHDEVLGVEIYAYPDKAAVAFTTAESASILTLSNSDFVVAMNQQVIPMMCH